MYCYASPPIDYWHGWMTYEEFVASVSRENDLEECARILGDASKLLREGREYAKKNLMWEGDDLGVRFSVIPTGDCEGALVIAWKQSNNGTTFIVCEREIPWLA